MSGESTSTHNFITNFTANLTTTKIAIIAVIVIFLVIGIYYWKSSGTKKEPMDESSDCDDEGNLVDSLVKEINTKQVQNVNN